MTTSDAPALTADEIDAIEREVQRVASSCAADQAAYVVDMTGRIIPRLLATVSALSAQLAAYRGACTCEPPVSTKHGTGFVIDPDCPVHAPYTQGWQDAGRIAELERQLGVATSLASMRERSLNEARAQRDEAMERAKTAEHARQDAEEERSYFCDRLKTAERERDAVRVSLREAYAACTKRAEERDKAQWYFDQAMMDDVEAREDMAGALGMSWDGCDPFGWPEIIARANESATTMKALKARATAAEARVKALEEKARDLLNAHHHSHGDEWADALRAALSPPPQDAANEGTPS